MGGENQNSFNEQIYETAGPQYVAKHLSIHNGMTMFIVKFRSKTVDRFSWDHHLPSGHDLSRLIMTDF